MSHLAAVFGFIGRLYAIRCALRPFVVKREVMDGLPLAFALFKQNSEALYIANGDDSGGPWWLRNPESLERMRVNK